MDIDRDALFAALALRSGRIDPDRLASAYEAMQKSAMPLAEVLVRRGDLGPGQRDEVQARLDLLLRQHPDDPNGLWLAAADDQVRGVMTSLSLLPFRPTIDSSFDPSEQAGTIASGTGVPMPGEMIDSAIRDQIGFHATAATIDSGASMPALGNGSAATIDSRGGPGAGGANGLGMGMGSQAETMDSAEAAAVADRFVGLVPLGPGSGEIPTSRYSRTHLHAQGGLGEIWRARDLVLGREVALKELKIKGSKHQAILWERFVAEARVTGQLEHPNIVPVHELGRHPEDGRPFYTMRFVRGRTLAEAIAAYRRDRDAGRDEALGLRRLLDVFIDVCNAVAFAHSRGVIHRDLKGQNVVLGDYGEALVIDWGLARPASGRDPAAAGGPVGEDASPGQVEAQVIAFDPSRAATQSGQILGTPAYMPPEQARGEIHKLGPASDIYSLGAILFEILTGRPPHVGASATHLLRLAREGTAPPPRSIDPSVPRALEAVCMRALGRQPADRYPTATALAEDVRRWLADEPVSVYRDSLPVRAARWSKRHRTGVAVASAVVLAVLPLLAASAVLIGRERDRVAAMEDLARSAVEDMYLDVADTVLADLSDPKQEEFLRLALDRIDGATGGGVVEDAAAEAPEAPPIDDAMRGPLVEALAYFRGFARDGGAGPRAALDAARARTRIGDITARLGRFDEAEASYRLAVASLEGPAGGGTGPVEARRRLAEARAHLGALLVVLGRSDQAEPLLLEAIDAREALLADDPEGEGDALALATAQVELAELQKLAGDFEEAESTYLEAIDRLGTIAEGPDAGVPSRRTMAGAADGLGVLLLMLDRQQEAEAQLRRAREVHEGLLAELPTVPTIREGLARTDNGLAVLLRRRGEPAEAEGRLRASIANFERLASDFPGRVEYHRAVARGLLNLGVLLSSTGQLAEAEQSYRRAVESYDTLANRVPGSLKVGRDRVFAMSNLGTVLVQLGQDDDAGVVYDRAVEAAGLLLERSPEVPDVRDAMGTALLNRGRLFDLLGDPDAASADLGRAASIFERLAQEHPDRPLYAQGQAASLAAMGPALVAGGQVERAEEAYRRSVAIFDRLLEDRPDDASLLADLALALANMGDLGRDDSEPLIRRSLDIYDDLASRQQPTPPEIVKFQGVMHYNLGDRLDQLGRAEEAEPEFAKGAEILVGLAESGGAGPEGDYLASLSSFDHARLILGRDDFDAARAPLERAVRHAERAADAIDTELFREALDTASDRLVGALLGLGRYAEAAGVAAELASALPDRPELRVRAAELLDNCITSVEADTGLDAVEARRLVDDFGRRALAQLRVALDSGLDPEALRERMDEFGPLRDWPEFRSLVPDRADGGTEE